MMAEYLFHHSYILWNMKYKNIFTEGGWALIWLRGVSKCVRLYIIDIFLLELMIG